MSDKKYLPFEGETLDEGRAVSVQYGTKWARFLIHAAQQLCDVEIWDPTSQREVAVQYANELICRLIGEVVMTGQQVAHLPMYITPLDMEPLGGGGITEVVTDSLYLFSAAIQSDTVEEYTPWIRFRVFLPTGAYDVRFILQFNTNRGSCHASATPDVSCSESSVSCYSATNQPNAGFTRTIDVLEPTNVEFTLHKHGKHPLATSGRLRLSGVIISKYIP